MLIFASHRGRILSQNVLNVAFACAFACAYQNAWVTSRVAPTVKPNANINVNTDVKSRSEAFDVLQSGPNAANLSTFVAVLTIETLQSTINAS